MSTKKEKKSKKPKKEKSKKTKTKTKTKTKSKKKLDTETETETINDIDIDTIQDTEEKEPEQDEEETNLSDEDKLEEDYTEIEDEEDDQLIEDDEEDQADEINFFKDDYDLLSKGDTIENRVTDNRLTLYEKTRIIGTRATQIANGAKPFIKNIKGLSPIEIAELELEKKICPIKIVRPLPNGRIEEWDVNEFIN